MRITKRERLLIVGITVLGVICGLVYWDQTRLSPEEQRFVGEWKLHNMAPYDSTLQTIDFSSGHTILETDGMSMTATFSWRVEDGILIINPIEIPFPNETFSQRMSRLTWRLKSTFTQGGRITVDEQRFQIQWQNDNKVILMPTGALSDFGMPNSTLTRKSLLAD